MGATVIPAFWVAWPHPQTLQGQGADESLRERRERPGVEAKCAIGEGLIRLYE